MTAVATQAFGSSARLINSPVHDQYVVLELPNGVLYKVPLQRICFQTVKCDANLHMQMTVSCISIPVRGTCQLEAAA